MKLPALQFYPGDWLRDDIAGCSLAAQGLWLRMMFIGHDCERYGYLCQNGSPIPPESIARRCGCTPAQYETLLAELDAAGIPSRTPEGIIFSRRMVRDATARTQHAERQRRHRDKQRDARVTRVSRKSDARSSPSSSSSVSTLNGSGTREVDRSVELHTHSPPNGVCVSKSKFSFEQNLQYAWAAYHGNWGVKQPDAWAAANLKTGNYDQLVGEYLADPGRFRAIG